MSTLEWLPLKCIDLGRSLGDKLSHSTTPIFSVYHFCQELLTTVLRINIEDKSCQTEYTFQTLLSEAFRVLMHREVRR